jgi:hypothetical protein
MRTPLPSSQTVSATLRGVFLADQPLVGIVPTAGETVLVVEIPEDQIVVHELREEVEGYREFLAPAEFVNRFPIVAVGHWLEFME